VEHAEEYLVFMKSRLNLFKDVSEQVKIVHSYEIPEILALPVIAGDQQYLGWLSVSLK
jgi:periplasmic divalent cation tolerance protein